MVRPIPGSFRIATIPETLDPVLLSLADGRGVSCLALPTAKRDAAAVLLHHQFTHSRSPNPIAEVDRVPVAVVIVKDAEAVGEGAGPTVVGKTVPLALVPKVGNTAKYRSFEFSNAPEWFDANNFPIRNPRPRLLEPALWMCRLADFEQVAASQNIEPTRIDLLTSRQARQRRISNGEVVRWR